MSYLLHIRFDVKGNTGDIRTDAAIAFPFEPATKKMNALPNLKWKIWAVRDEDPDSPEGGGFYLYPTAEAAQARAEQAKATLPHIPGVSNVTTTIWEVLDDYSLATHAPVDVPLIAELEKAANP